MKLNRKATYYKVTNKEENHHGLQYHDGIVKDIVLFCADNKQSCVAGGIYFTDIHHIGNFYGYGCWVRKITIPEKAKVVLDPEGDKFRANMVKMGKRIDKIAFLAKLPKKYLGSLDLSGCDIKGITLPTSIGGSLYLSGCDLKGITLPTSIGGSLYLRGCDLKGITLPTSIGGYLDLSGCDIPKKLDLSKYSVIR